MHMLKAKEVNLARLSCAQLVGRAARKLSQPSLFSASLRNQPVSVHAIIPCPFIFLIFSEIWLSFNLINILS